MATDQYCVFGNPIQHSLSPEIHSQFARETGEIIEYKKKLIAEETFETSVSTFFSEGGKGLNITVPFKERAWALAESLTERARLAGAVNTLWQNHEGLICGDNTDGAGLVSDLCARNGWVLTGKKILILGAGGAARGVVLPLLAEKPHCVCIANRTLSKAEALVEMFSPYGTLMCSSFEGLSSRFDIIINATSASLGSDLPPISASLIDENTAVYDMVYGKEPTAFLQWAKKQGATRLSDGLGMLVGQAAESFYLWRGVLPSVNGVIAQLRER